MVIGTGTAILGAAGLGAAGSLASGILGRKGSQEQAQAARKGLKVERQNFLDILNLLQPQIEIGDEAREAIAAATGLRGTEAQRGFFQGFETDPGFQRTVDFGTQNILSNRSALGLRQSGGTLKAVQQFGQLSLQDAFNTRLNRLGGLAGGGQAAASNLAGLQSASGARQANLLLQGGAARAGGFQALGGAAQGVAQAGGFALGGLGQLNLLQRAGVIT